MRSISSIRGVVIALALLLGIVPAVGADDPADPANADTTDGHTIDDPEELGVRDHEHGIDADGNSVVGGGTLGPYFNESGGCADPLGITTPMSTTNSSANRSLPSGHQVRGPWGDFYGRDYGDVAGSMVNWTVPMSGGKVVKVHQRAFPAFQRVSANLAAEAAAGRFYDVRMAATWVWRRIGGSYRMSTHSFGSTIDINWDTNPYSSSNTLITDMPAWFVKAWTDAGFCWGGDWQTIKDAMHFSWKGPLRTPGYGDLPGPYAPSTATGNYSQVAFASNTTFGPHEDGAAYFFGEGNSDGAPDLFRVRDWAQDDLLIEYARSSRDFQYCGVSETVVPGAGAAPGELMIADYDGDNRPDVWKVDTSGPVVRLTVFTYASGYGDAVQITTGAPSIDGGGFGAADFDRDGEPDFYLVERKSTTRVRVYSGASGFVTPLVNKNTQLGATASEGRWHYALTDIDVDGIPDLAAIRVEDDVSLRVLYGKDNYAGSVGVKTTAAHAHQRGVYSMGDWDGDGRPDLLSHRPNGIVQVHLGGVQSGSTDFWFQNPGWSCEGSGTKVPWDVSGDRIADLVVGVPYEDVGNGKDAGLINVLYGTTSGPATGGNQVWHQDSAGVESVAEANDRFGTTMAWGDFDRDGVGDLAVGAPHEDIGSINGAGAVTVLYGGDGALTGNDSQLISQDTAGIQGTSQPGDHFGAALAAGDFDGDGWDDLAVGAPDDYLDAGVVNVLYGTKQGLSSAGNQLWYQNVNGVFGSSDPGDQFGAALTVGDFDADGYDDLAIGVPGADWVDAPESGAVVVLYGGANGLTSTGSDQWSQAQSKIADSPDPDDRFGAALAAGDYDGDGFDDLAVGAPGEEVDGRDGAGQVHIIFGKATGLKAAGDRAWNQNTGGIPGTAQKNDDFGAALSAGDTNGDGYDDLAVGVWLENIAGIGNAGAATTLLGSEKGVTGRGAVQWRQGFGGLIATSEAGDRFGGGVRFADLDGNGFDDLIITIAREDLDFVDEGVVMVIYAGENGLSPSSAEIWYQDVNGVADQGEANDRFGSL